MEGAEGYGGKMERDRREKEGEVRKGKDLRNSRDRQEKR